MKIYRASRKLISTNYERSTKIFFVGTKSGNSGLHLTQESFLFHVNIVEQTEDDVVFVAGACSRTRQSVSSKIHSSLTRVWEIGVVGERRDAGRTRVFRSLHRRHSCHEDVLLVSLPPRFRLLNLYAHYTWEDMSTDHLYIAATLARDSM